MSWAMAGVWRLSRGQCLERLCPGECKAYILGSDCMKRTVSGVLGFQNSGVPRLSSKFEAPLFRVFVKRCLFNAKHRGLGIVLKFEDPRFMVSYLFGARFFHLFISREIESLKLSFLNLLIRWGTVHSLQKCRPRGCQEPEIIITSFARLQS